MFTGIVEEVGRIARVEELGGARRFEIEARFASELRVDQSVSVSGACQTVVHAADGRFEVVAVEETLLKTSFGRFEPGTRVNLERAMRMNGRIDGHLVQGHVDAAGEVDAVEVLPNSRLYRIRFDPAFERYVVPVGSITVDGISLTVARLEAGALTVAIIPYTFEHTNVPDWREGAAVNLEFDLIGKYVARWMGGRESGIGSRKSGGSA